MARVTFERLKELEKKFDEVQWKYSDYGAADTEPRAVFRECARRTIEDGEPYVVTTADEWELFTYSKKCGRAARALTAAARKVMNALAKAPHSVVRQFKNYYL